MTLYMVELGVNNLSHGVRWYRDVCGLTFTVLDEPNGFALLSGEDASGFTRLALKRQTPPVVGGVRLHFLVDDLDAELARLAALGVPLESPPKTSDEGYRRAVVTDPDGHPITLFEWVTSSPPAPSRT